MLRREGASIGPNLVGRKGGLWIRGLRGDHLFLVGAPDARRQVLEAVYLGEGRHGGAAGITPTGRHYWLFANVVYSTIHSLGAEDVTALASADQKRAAAKIAAARAWLDVVEEPGGRRPIPDEVKILVWQRDGGRCARCRSDSNLEFDHIIPIAMGGSSTARNLQLLCSSCNREKSANLV